MAISFRKKPSGGGFYEVFSDLIFGMMAIFVLLFIVLMVLIRPPPPENPPPKKADLVVAIDVSGSMGEQIAELKIALDELGINFPNIIDEFRVGIVPFRDENFPNGENDVAPFPITRMNEESMQELRSFLDGYVEAIGGSVDPIFAAKQAIREFASARIDDDRLRVLVVIGDVAPEYYVEPPMNNNPLDSVAHHLRLFVEESENNRVLSLFSGAEASGQNRDFYCAIARAAGDQGRFADGSELLVWELLEELWKGTRSPDDEETQNALPC